VNRARTLKQSNSSSHRQPAHAETWGRKEPVGIGWQRHRRGSEAVKRSRL
jgi:hypothetical protein